jgi:hypothetical protein
MHYFDGSARPARCQAVTAGRFLGLPLYDHKCSTLFRNLQPVQGEKVLVPESANILILMDNVELVRVSPEGLGQFVHQPCMKSNFCFCIWQCSFYLVLKFVL